MTKKCRACEVWDKKRDSPEYQNCIDEHDCLITHTGSAGSMEPSGVVQCFSRSVATLKLRYENHIDDDSKAYQEVVKADPYKGLMVKKGNVWAISKSVLVHD